MTTTSAISPIDHRPSPTVLSRASLGWGIALAVLFVGLYHTWLFRMYRIAMDRWGGDWSHAIVIPAISAYFVWQQRERLLQVPKRLYWPGLPIMFLGILSYAWWIHPGRNDMLQGYSMILSLFGMVLFLFGPRVMTWLWVPITYLMLGVKVSDRIWEAIAWKLQLLAAKASSIVLTFCGLVMDIEANVSGSTIEMGYMENGQWVSHALNVAEACSGLRMLAAFVALGVAVAFYTERPRWQRIIMVLMTVPIAVLVNVGRVTSLGLLHLVDEELARGDVHKFVGLIMLIPALMLFVLLGWVLDRIIIPDPNAKKEREKRLEAKYEQLRHKGPVANARPVAGVIGGICLAIALGITYGFMFASLRPSLLGDAIQQNTATALFVSAGVLLVGGMWIVRKMFQPIYPPNARPNQITSLALCAGILLTSAVGLQAVVKHTKAVLIKKPVPLRQPLVVLPAQIGSWELIHDERLPDEILEELRTENYISRTYRNTTLEETDPASIMRLHVAYYTGTPDTVPHVPDRCYVAGGLTPINKGIATLQVEGDNYKRTDEGIFAKSQLHGGDVSVPADNFSATIFTFGSPDDPKLQSNVMYFFAANGKFLATPDLVRLQGFDLRDEYSYYCKIEVGAVLIRDPNDAIRLTGHFLSEVLPEILACLPDWSDVSDGKNNTQGPGN